MPLGDLEDPAVRPPSQNGGPSQAQRAELSVAASRERLPESGFPNPGGGGVTRAGCGIDPWATSGKAGKGEHRNGDDCRERSHTSIDCVHETRRLARLQDDTIGVAADDAEADPATLVAVTTTRMVLPTSLDVSTYVWLRAPEMLAQLPPEASHRCHWYA